MRRNNISDMTIHEQIEGIKTDVCERICKYYEEADGRIKAIKGQDQALRCQIIEVVQTELEKHCDQCSVKRL